MGVLFDYFAAESDAVAATVLNGGPGQVERALPFVDGKGIDPIVMMGKLAALLTGRTDEQVDAERGVLEPVASAGDEGPWVERLPESLVTALPAATEGRLRDVAVPWSQIEEFWGHGNPDVLAGFLSDLADVARRAQQAGQHLYCWSCL
jgi:hypothetical protein